MIKYEGYDLKDFSDFAPILELEAVYGNNDLYTNQRLLNILKRAGGRVVTASDGDEEIGYYVYAPYTKWTLISGDPFGFAAINSKLQEDKVSLDLCTVPVFVHLTPEYADQQSYLDFNAARVRDAVESGYNFGVVGINSFTVGDDYCYQSDWMESKEVFAENTNSEFVYIGEYKENNVYLQRYGV